ncbi:conserved hypothetical protein [Acinetobacter proteolyticus]|uniref:Uncharacterized protein n=1 Tax=Acinetobacter proteolyticus TaxID=1776741 RepID=A0A653KB04_9GAMM|nr:conserved hypothetical protein [Acinetobacter proteolyticus]
MSPFTKLMFGQKQIVNHLQKAIKKAKKQVNNYKSSNFFIRQF